jgi:hypothetical protein
MCAHAIRRHHTPIRRHQTPSDAISGVRHLQSMLGRHLMAMQLNLRRAQPALQRRILLARIVQLLRDDLGAISIRRALPTQPGNLLLRRRARIVTFVPLPSEESSAVIRGHQRSSDVIRGHQGSSEVIRGHQTSSEVIRGHQTSSEVIRRHQTSSEVIRGHQRSSEVIRGHQRSSEVIRGHQRSSEVIRGHQRSSEVISGHQ